MDVFKLDEDVGDQFDGWIDGLVEAGESPERPAEVNVRLCNRSAWAAWTGHPFVLVGNAGSLRIWFDGLDATSAELIRNHALYWVLTSRKGVRHELISEIRLTVLDWSRC